MATIADSKGSLDSK